MPGKGNVRSQSIVSQQSYKAMIIADLVAEVQEETDGNELVKRELNQGLKLNASELNKVAPVNNAPVIIHPQDSAPQVLSWGRKFAILVSSFPAIFFVLFFAVILPCEQKYLSCVQKSWSISLGQTEITSQLELAENVIYSFKRGDVEGIQCIDSTSGKHLWEKNVTSSPIYLQCASESCVMKEKNGHLHLFHSVDGKKIWDLDEKRPTSLPVLLPDCTEDGVDEVAMVVSKDQLQVIYKAGSAVLLPLSNCSSFPNHLIPWTTQNKTDLILICDNGEEDLVTKIPANRWCTQHNGTKDQITILTTAKKGQFSNKPEFLSTPKRLLVWAEDELFVFNENGQSHLEIPISNHSLDNRFLLYGTLNCTSQVILGSSDRQNSFQVTLLDPSKSKDFVTDYKRFPNMEVTHAEVLHGKEKDLLLILNKHFPNNSSLEREEVNVTQLNGENLKLLSSLSYKGETNKTLLKALNSDKKEDTILKIFILREFKGNSSTQFDCFSLENWDEVDSKCEEKTVV